MAEETKVYLRCTLCIGRYFLLDWLYCFHWYPVHGKNSDRKHITNMRVRFAPNIPEPALSATIPGNVPIVMEPVSG